MPSRLNLVVVTGHGALSLVHLDKHPGLVVGVGREHLRLLRRDRSVALDERGYHAAGRFKTEAQRSHVQQQKRVELVGLVLARQDRSLHGGAVGHGLVGVDGLTRLLAVEVIHQHLLRHIRYSIINQPGEGYIRPKDSSSMHTSTY